MQTNAAFAKLEALGAVCRQWAPKLFFGGEAAPVLEFPLVNPTRVIRLSLSGYIPLHLPLVRIMEWGNQIPLDGIKIGASSIYDLGGHATADEALAEQARSMFGLKPGEGVHTATDMNPWVEITLPRTMSGLTFRVGNRHDVNAWRNWTLKVETSADGANWLPAYDHADLATSVKHLLLSGSHHNTPEERLVVAAFIEATFSYLNTGSIDRDKLFHKLSPVRGGLAALTAVMNRNILWQFGHEINVHGVVRTFRFWSESEKAEYLKDAYALMRALESLSPDVAIGYGAVLSYVRSGTFIDHDDDIDILIALDREAYPTIPAAVRAVEEALGNQGWATSGDFFAHRWVSLGHKNVDVFVGLREGDFVSFFPGPRCGLLHSEIFPAMSATLHGQEILIPRQPFGYLEKVYGSSWRTPDPNFSHTWDQSIFSDLEELVTELPLALKPNLLPGVVVLSRPVEEEEAGEEPAVRLLASGSSQV